MVQANDRPAMRPALDIENFADLENYLRAGRRIPLASEIQCERLAGGVSNRTVLVRRAGGTAIVLKQALSQLRVDAAWLSSPERIRVEAQALQWLPKLTTPAAIPAFLFEDPENHLLAMEAVPDPHRNWKSLLMQGTILPAHFAGAAALLGAIHRNAFEHSRELSRVFHDRSFFTSLRLEPYYLWSAQQVPQAREFLLNLVDGANDCRITLVHGDFSPKNILISGGGLVLLDYEAVHMGDPAFDPGFCLTHFLSKGHRIRDRRPEFLAAAGLYWQTYQRTIADSPISIELEPRVVQHTLGCLLARAAGKSPLEYLRPDDRRRQIEIVCSLIRKPPSAVGDLIAEFGAELEKHADNR